MKREALHKDKLHALADQLERLGVDPLDSLFAATGLLERLWGFTAQNCPTGSLAGKPPRRIATGIGWQRDAAALLAALRAEDWLDGEPGAYTIHDWPDHADRHVHRMLIRRRQTFADGTVPTRSYAKSEAERCIWDEEWGDSTPSGVAPRTTSGAITGAASGAPSQSQSQSHVREAAPPGAGKADDCGDLARGLWKDVCAAFAMYGGDAGQTLGKARLGLVCARLRENPDEDPRLLLVGAVHGYWICAGERNGDYDPRAHLCPETVFSSQRHQRYVDAARTAKARGHCSPFKHGDNLRDAPPRRAPAAPQPEEPRGKMLHELPEEEQRAHREELRVLKDRLRSMRKAGRNRAPRRRAV